MNYFIGRQMSSAANYMQQLGKQLGEALGAGYKFYKSRLEFRARVGEGDNVIVLSGATKSSPLISVAFYFGRNFLEAKRIEKLIGEGYFYYHIQQYSPNQDRMPGLGYSGPSTWEVDIREPIGTELVSAIIAAISGVALPFFARFLTIQAARDAIASDDPWCFGGKPFWRQLLFLDAAMNDLTHFREWSVRLDELQLREATEELLQVERAISNAT